MCSPFFGTSVGKCLTKSNAHRALPSLYWLLGGANSLVALPASREMGWQPQSWKDMVERELLVVVVLVVVVVVVQLLLPLPPGTTDRFRSRPQEG